MVAWCCYALLLLAPTESTNQANGTPASPPPVAQGLDRFEARLLEIEHAASQGQKLEPRILALEAAPERIDRQVSHVLSLMESFLAWLEHAHWALAAVVGVLLAVFTFLGFKEYRQLKEWRGKAQDAADAAAKAQAAAEAAKRQSEEAAAGLEQDARAARAHLEAMRRQAESTASILGSLPLLGEAADIVGVRAPSDLGDLATAAQYEDVDDQLRVLLAIGAIPPNDAQLPQLLERLGRFWRATLHFPRAIRRFRAALEQAGNNPELHRELGRTYQYYVAEYRVRLAPGAREALIQEGRRSSKRAVELMGGHSVKTLIDQHFALDELARVTGQWDGAIAAGTEAVERARKESYPERWLVEWNLCCSLRLAGREGQAIQMLVDVIQSRLLSREQVLSKVSQDEDLTPLLGHSDWHLVQEA